jgi:D-arabinose 1-dehydrogenase-like Zn-dependent alcohol dehydrogenase
VMRNLRLQGVYVGHRESFRAMLEAFARAELRPVIDSVHALERVQDAFARLESGRHFGKICLKI